MTTRTLFWMAFALLVSCVIAGSWLAAMRSTNQSIEAPVDVQSEPVSEPNDPILAINERALNVSSPPNDSPTPILDDANSILRSAPLDSVEPALMKNFFERHRVKDYRIVTIAENELRAYLRDSANKPNLELNLLGDYTVELVPRETKESVEGWQAGFANFSGTVAGVELSSVSLFANPDGSIKAFITTPEGHFRIERSERLPYHIVWSMAEYEVDIE